MRNFLICLLLTTSLLAKDEYYLGEGMQVQDLPLYLGGYISLDYKSSQTEDRYRINDVAFLAYGNHKKFSYVAEFEAKEFYTKRYTTEADSSTYNSRVYAERVFLNYTLNENYQLKIGKYNSPVGLWNLYPINVFRETTSNPASTYIIYPKYTTGLLASYQSFGDGELSIDYMLQHNEDVDHEYNNYEIDKHYGFGVSYQVDDYSAKINGGHFHKVNLGALEDELYYVLLSAKYETDTYQVLSELGKQRSNDKVTTNYAGYIQGLYRYTQKHIAVMRVEAIDDRVNNINEELIILGLTYRPLYPVAIKYEYRFHSQNKLNQSLISLSVLF